jgi:Dolichyl-phosphate-mannose-protein mannosyltransferase
MSPGDRKRALAVWLAILGVAAVFRLGFLTRDSLWLDEVYSVRLASDHTAADIWAGHLDDRHPPLFYVVLRGALTTAGTAEWTARLPSALASLLGVPLLFVLARNLGLTVRGATAAAILMAVAPLDIWYAREARMYALVALAALVFAIGITWESWRGVPIAAAALTAGLFLDYTTVPLAAALVALGVSRWWVLGRPAPVLIRLALSVLAAAWLSRSLGPVLVDAANRLHQVTFFTRLGEITNGTWPGAGGTAVLLIVIATAFTIAGVLMARGLRHDPFRRGWTALVWIGFAASTVALALPRAYSAKQILVTGWPFVVIVAAWSLTDGVAPAGAGRGSAGRLRLPAMLVFSVAASLYTLTTHRADWRGAVSYLNGHAASSDRVIVVPEWNQIPYDYYRPILAAAPGALPPAQALATATGDIWLIAERFGTRSPSSPAEAWLDGNLRLMDTVPFSRLELRRYRSARGG